ncbi:ASCH domain-containing protein [Vibrio sp. 10N.286.49.C2]|uniref:N(4)-acetylcytidine aminohydrolase n=1 Tax=unclassified Vibrio TaxID=2614977 RepID=UPI000C85CDE0|nr:MULTISPECIES: N(4)-acetylcytidine aminohydrolase [unclassified Vibrio]PMH34894.1 ASCH domain-containing protein [Vibrio sp. 10N.286.49.C2]PMH51462.1 ASCH domain-containing protein [Vibrio sp. 10N.286.49.B1]PMH78359.1 ASCH domain-containing protein [Vibrio sp. 10N.286.48.B7]
MTFFERFETDILAQTKTITIRDASEKDYEIGNVVPVSTFEDGREFCHVKVLSVKAIDFDEINDLHAEQENMTLPQLKEVIEEIYPGEKQLYVIDFELA